MRAFVVALSVLLASVSIANAQPLYVVSTEAGAPGELVIKGTGFAPGAIVLFDLVNVPVVSVSLTEVRVTIGAAIPGSHWLIVYQPATAQFAQFWTTVGAVGPPGPPGPPGPSGGIVNQSADPQDASFNISGTGSAATINAENVISMRGMPIVSINGFLNMFVGWGAGEANTTGIEQAFFGVWAGKDNTTGTGNTFIGGGAGRTNRTGNDNTFVGRGAGFLNAFGSRNTFVGSDAGRNVSGSSALDNTFVGRAAGFSTFDGSQNTFVGTNAGADNRSSGNAFFGFNAGANNSFGGANTLIGWGAHSNPNDGMATAVGSNAYADGPETTAIGADARATGTGATAIGKGAVSTFGVVIGGANNPAVQLNGDAHVFGKLSTGYGMGGITPVCRVGPQLAACSSSRRYKTGIRPYRAGLALLGRLHPVSFDWKFDGTRDLGFVAEEVARVDSRLVTRNEDGQIEGVKYDRLTAVLVNAIREQQAQIERQQRQIDELRRLVSQRVNR